jgi:DNA-binding response OmpR family regulator/REP element-mobilizing transposase RayT
MAAKVLIATPHGSFGELIRQSLEDGEKYQTRVVDTAQVAISLAEKNPFDLAVLDADLPDLPAILLAKILLGHHPKLRLLLVPPDNNPDHPSIAGLKPHGYLTRPFYLPAMLEMVDHIMRSPEPAEVLETPPNPVEVASKYLPWLADRSTADRYLTCLQPESLAQALLVTRAGVVLARSGQLCQTDFDEITAILERYWDNTGHSDLARFIRTSEGNKTYMLYTTQIIADLAFSLIYEPDTPLSRCHSHAVNITEQLTTQIPDEQLLAELEKALATSAVLSASTEIPCYKNLREELTTSEEETIFEEENSLVQALRTSDQPNSLQIANTSEAKDESNFSETSSSGTTDSGEITENNEDEDLDDTNLDEEKINLIDLLSTMPPPNPEPVSSGWVTENSSQPMEFQFQEPLSSRDEPTNPPKVARESISSANQSASIQTETEQNTFSGELKPQVTNKTQVHFALPWEENSICESISLNEMPTMPLSHEELPIPGPEENTLTKPWAYNFSKPEDLLPAPLLRFEQLSPPIPTLTYLYFTCILIPRMPNHFLTGTLAILLSQIFPQLCLAFGWRLEGLSVRPDYLQWTIQIAPAVTPGNVMRILRLRTSQRIFQSFSNLAFDNPSGDFWAPGYLIVSGSQAPAIKLLRDFIQQTRRRQGT